MTPAAQYVDTAAPPSTTPLFLASDELMPKQKGRKALIILSDGVDRGSKETLVKAIEAAQRADTIIYAIYFKGEEHHCRTINPRRRRLPGGGYPGGGYPGGRIPAVATGGRRRVSRGGGNGGGTGGN